MAKNKKRKKAKVVKIKRKFRPSTYLKENGRFQKLERVLCGNENNGLCNIFVVRQRKNGDYLVCGFLVDKYCLGVKDTSYQYLSEEQYFDYLEKITGHFNFTITDPNFGFNMIYQAVEYAKNLGIEPHSDYTITKNILPPIETLEAIEIEFGNDGRPMFIPGPYDNIADIHQKLNATVGPEGYDFLEGMEGSNDIESIENHNEYIASILPIEKDRDAYYNYSVIFQSCSEKFENKIDQLKELFLNNQIKLEKDINIHLKEEGLLKDDSSKLPIEFIVPLVENILILSESEFLSDQFIIKVFDSRERGKPENLIADCILFKTGKTKISQLLHSLSVLKGASPDQIESPENVMMDIEKWRADYDELHNEDEIIIFIGDYLLDWEEVFGLITLDYFNDGGGGG